MQEYVQLPLFCEVSTGYITGVFTQVYTDGYHIVFTCPLNQQLIDFFKAQATVNPQMIVEDLSADGVVYVRLEGLGRPFDSEEIPF